MTTLTRMTRVTGGCTGVFWAVLSCTGLYWAVPVVQVVQVVRVVRTISPDDMNTENIWLFLV